MTQRGRVYKQINAIMAEKQLWYGICFRQNRMSKTKIYSQNI